MGRRSKTRVLTVWMNGELVGEWRRPYTGGGEFLYAESWLSSPNARPISLSLPLRPSREPFRAGVEAFFENLLPDNRQIRERIQRRFRTESIRAFDLLAEIGRDCVGALQLLPTGDPPPEIRQITAQRLTDQHIAKLLAGLLDPMHAEDADSSESFRISLAGAQEKTALLFHAGRWHRPTHTTPTTHIIKLPLGVNPQGIDLTTSVENEWLCAQMVRAYGLDVASCQAISFGQFKALVVERFDRKLASDSTWYLRLPQEDLCQATGTPPGLKYESDGGPGIAKIMSLLRNSEEAVKDQRNFMLAQLVFWMLAAIDGHGKNFSFFLLPGGGYKLTPLYDVLSAYPILGHGRGKLEINKVRMAMAVEGKNRHYRWKEIHARHWIQTARKYGFREMHKLIVEAIEKTPGVVEQVAGLLPHGFPAQIADSILNGTKQAARALAEDLTDLRSSI